MDSAHLSALSARHAGIDRRIEEENKRPLPDGSAVAALKKQKLKVKEALAGLTR